MPFPTVRVRAALMWVAVALCVTLSGGFLAADDGDAAPEAIGVLDPGRAAAEVDRLLEASLREAGVELAPLTSDEDFLRRISFDLAGSLPTPREVTLFGLDADSRKRAALIDRLLESDAFSENWARYFRDVIFTRATETRSLLGRPAFETWMREQLAANAGWDDIATAMLTATGDVREAGETALMFAHGGDAQEIAAEASRIFLGVQIQCANCHDHPYDKWKREQFHQFAAFFPRIRVRLKQDGDTRSFEVVSFNVNFRGGFGGGGVNPGVTLRRFDRNRDGKLTKFEVANTQFAGLFERLLNRLDTNKDNALSLAELQRIRQLPAGRGAAEYYMPDLDDPASRGRRIDPVFFATGLEAESGLDDVARRQALAEAMTSLDHPWFARAFVNRIWAELLGRGFYMPVDDIGPERTASFPEVLEFLSDGFAATGYDIKWLFRTVTNTTAYQRKIRPVDPAGDEWPFAATTPTRLRADQVYSALVNVLGEGVFGRTVPGRQGGIYRVGNTARAQFATLFGFDPSTPQADLTGTVPQALFMMNSPLVNRLIQAQGTTRLARILSEFDDDQNAIEELYLLVLARQPSDNERQICREYLAEVESRSEAFEDLMWGLLNSSEFLSKR